MANVKKNKKNKKNLADVCAQRRKIREKSSKTISPFNILPTKDKKQVLGRKLKNDKGKPGISRTKAIDKRKKTLLVEYNIRDKDNMFLDRRIGEKNVGMTEEDKVMARFAAERIKEHKKSIYNLNDCEVLTHRGQALIDIEKYDDPRSDEESDDEKSGNLNKKFVEEAHFGGGVLSKPKSEMSRKEVIDKLIAESKMRKAERQMTKEKTLQITEELNKEWKDLIPLLAPMKSTKDDNKEKKVDDYDKVVRQMQFDKRGRPTDKLKLEEETTKQDRVKLEKLEAERLSRMKGFSEEAEFNRKHKSVDDLDDFHIEVIEENSNDEGEDEQENLKNGKKEQLTKESDNEGNESSNEGSGGESGEEEEDEDENEEGEEQDEDDENEEYKEESEDNLSDLKASESESEDEVSEAKDLQPKSGDELSDSESEPKSELSEEEVSKSEKKEEKKQKQVRKNEEKKVQVNDDKKSNEIISKKTETLKNNAKENTIVNTIEQKQGSEIEKVKVQESLKKEYVESSTIVKQREAIMQYVRKTLPDTIEVPKSYEELLNLFKDRNPIYQSIIVERIIKCCNYKESTENRSKMLNLFKFLLQYLNECSNVNSTEALLWFFQTFDRLSPQLYDLRDINVLETKGYFCTVLKEKHEKFESRSKYYPGLDTLILFKLASNLYPTSDFRHPIVTPCLVFMSQILRCKVKKKSDISKGLFVCTLILEYTIISKRWSPEAINFLHGIIYISIPKLFSKVLKVVPPFKRIGESSNLLVLEKNHEESYSNLSSTKMSVKDFTESEIDDDFKIRTFLTTINLLCEFVNHCKELDASYLIFEAILALLTLGSVNRYPKKIQERVQFLVSEIKKLKENKLEPLQFPKKKLKALRMIEPQIEQVFDKNKHHPNIPAEQRERQKLIAKVKSEKKSAKRELRRDNAFLANVKIKEQIKADEERKRKVREIYGDAAMQQHELKKFKRK